REVLNDDIALDAHLWREVSAGLGEIRRKNLELANGLGAADLRVRRVDGALHLGDHLRVDARLSEGQVAVFAVVLEPGRQHLNVESDESRDEGLLVADDDDLTDDRVGANRVFESRRRHILAAGGDDELLLATSDLQ